MKTVKVKAAFLRAAMFMQGINDVRYYLNGIQLTKDGYINATNGHCLYRGKDETMKGLSSDITIAIDGKIPARAETAVLHFVDKESGYLSFEDSSGHELEISKAKRRPVRRFFDVLEGKYPELDRVIPKTDPQPISDIGVNAEYMGLVGNIAKAMGCRSPVVKFSFRDQHSVIEADIISPFHTAKAYIMPARV
ncbi:hypothetical protein [Neptuniibacter sp.]|uniref:hypothetical protein n=1 Tax=Neptuniibacter sp. TaxID=1962643 RepID=UPI00261CB180|nr:hypothetical protein [Neptuniibacter sp.]MCP4596177.1 hypothetical protein [Neptuniibacter sp.]